MVIKAPPVKKMCELCMIFGSEPERHFLYTRQEFVDHFRFTHKPLPFEKFPREELAYSPVAGNTHRARATLSAMGLTDDQVDNVLSFFLSVCPECWSNTKDTCTCWRDD